MAKIKRMCSNCRGEIPIETFDLHEARCRKYCKYCSECGETVPLSELSAHESEAHIPKSCPQCNASVHPSQTEAHKEVCPQALVVCKYCELEKPRRYLPDHLDACGSRTQECDLCTLRVQLRDMEEHQTIKCGHLRAEPNLDPHTLEHLTFDSHTTCGSTMQEDEALALRLQEEEHRPHRTPHSPPHRTPHTDVELARLLQDEEVRRDKMFGRDLELAQQLQQEEGTHSTQPHYTQPPVGRDRMFGRDLELAQQLQQEEETHSTQPHYTQPPVGRDRMFGRDRELQLAQHLQEEGTHSTQPPLAGPPSVEEGLPCQFCYQLFPSQTLTLHQNSCCDSVERKSVPTAAADDDRPQAASYEEEGIEEKLPCESCGQLFSFSTLHRHQVACSLHPPTQQ
ncbi:TRAF-type zinc finger domain-containing protein 1-like isoform X2 [Halichondria panicea]|uniref:TRAF-type zinc finger domain-containing protein 1-like isoform X2 n=1 Tax=Halichondria panicea TaxID=6063 RepID=UPI00312B726C